MKCEYGPCPGLKLWISLKKNANYGDRSVPHIDLELKARLHFGKNRSKLVHFKEQKIFCNKKF